MVGTLFAVIVIGFVLYQFYYYRKRSQTKTELHFLPSWRNILIERVSFYNKLTKPQRLQFESDLLRFLNDTTITGVKCKVEDIDKVLIGASAVIPLFGFDNWGYPNLDEVLLYANRFSSDHQIDESSNTLGMVGTGYMNGSMILSKPDLRAGFLGEKDARNVGIHEFSHLIDKFDGAIDGIPEYLLVHPYSIQWVELIRKKMIEIQKGNSDINTYALTGPEEFFAVTSEYFFEDANRMAKKHPELHEAMSRMFKQNLKTTTNSSKFKPGRNDSCPCGSGKKHKRCCGK
ncbi:MAG: Mlc titration factor MtfA (ptsG expression regulator) [Litorivivens sp.]|jgi:Mlc titration factor MtfA (ptsG expression regulator)